MKKIILTAAALSLFLVSNLASASSLKDIIPAITEIYFELNSTAKNPLQDYLITQIPQKFADSIFLDTDYELEKSGTQLKEEENKKTAISKAYSDILTNNTLSLGLNLPGDIQVGAKVTDIQYQNFIDALGAKATVESENPKIYLTREDFFFTKSGDVFISAPTKEKLLSTLNNTEDKLSTNPDYKNISSEFNAEDTLTLYISNSIFNNLFKDSPENLKLVTGITESFKAFGHTLKKTTTGINSKTIITFDPEKAKKNGINSTAGNFTPLLYKYLPSENPIFYAEFSNLKSTITTATNLALKTGEFSASDLEIPTEIETYLSILEKEIAIYVQKDTQILPAITIILNTSSHKNIAKEIIAKLTIALEDELKSKNIEHQQATNKNLTTFTFDLNKLDPAGQIPDGINKISLTFGTTAEDYLIFSTYSKISSKYGEGLTKNSGFKNAFSNLNQTVSGISYLNIENLADWYDKILDTASQTNTSEFTKKQIETNHNLFKQAKKPWHDLSMIYKTTETKSSTEINLNFDIDALNLDYIEVIDDLFSSSRKASKSFMKSRQTFNDTPPDGWYYNDIRELNARGVINGYEDKTFKPNSNISRAEFLTMILKAFNENYSETYYAGTASSFTDVSQDDWFANAVAKGTNDGLIKGYDDNSFHPNSPISRAEAVSILHKAIKFRFGEDVKLSRRSDTGNFSDVNYNDWYYNDVLSLYDYSIIDGEKDSYNFFPNRNLNRAEASKIINKTLEAVETFDDMD